MSGRLDSPWRKLRRLAPHDAVRLHRRLVAPRSYRRMQAMRTAPVLDADSVSLAPFVERRAIFVHIPKCAGLALSKAVFGCRGGAHMPIESYMLAFSRAEFRSFFKFTVVRNPWDRVVSAYHFLSEGGLGESDRRMAETSVALYPDFPSFVEGFIGGGDFNRILHFRQQWRFLCLTPSSPPEVDFVGRFETLSDDFRTICERIGVSPELVHVNRGRSRPQGYRELYDERSADIVARAYARDIALFGYAF
jgi:hypothetical protein